MSGQLVRVSLYRKDGTGIGSFWALPGWPLPDRGDDVEHGGQVFTVIYRKVLAVPIPDETACWTQLQLYVQPSTTFGTSR